MFPVVLLALVVAVAGAQESGYKKAMNLDDRVVEQKESLMKAFNGLTTKLQDLKLTQENGQLRDSNHKLSTQNTELRTELNAAKNQVSKVEVQLENTLNKREYLKEEIESITQNSAHKRYDGAIYSWPFQKTIYRSWHLMESFDIKSNRAAILVHGANIATSDERGSHLVLHLSNTKVYGANQYPWVDFGDFRGKCVSDPSVCKKGITIMFWIRLTSEMIKKQKARGFKTQYILSSGAQNKRSRGIAYYYQEKDNWKGLKFVVQTRHKTYTLPMDMLPEKWVFLTFTWTKEDGVTYYQDGEKMYSGMSQVSKRTTDVESMFTLAKPNDQNTNFGRFQMDDFTVYYKALTASEVKKVAKGAIFH